MNMRAVIRANRLLAEMGFNNTVDALEELQRLRAGLPIAPDLSRVPVFAWASNRQPKAIHHEVKNLWLKVRAEQVEDYTEPLVLLADVRAAIAKATGEQA